MTGLHLRQGIAALAALASLALAPAAASAANRYVDEAGSDDDVTCPQGDPCQTLQYALNNSQPEDEIHVDGGTYLAGASLGDGRSIEFDDFVADTPGPAIVEGGTGTAIAVPVSGAGHIRGLTIRGNVSGVTLDGLAEVDGNVFDDADATGAVGVQVNGGGAGSTIHDNEFEDPAPSATRGRIGVASTFAHMTIADNTFSGFNVAISAQGWVSGETVVEGNEVSDTHSAPFAGRSILAGGGGSTIVRENTLSDAANDTGLITGVSAGSSTHLVRNEITGHGNGVQVGGDSTNVSLEGDRIWGNSNFGLTASDFNGTPPQTSVTATNVTIVDVGAFNDGASLTFDSSIVDGIGIGASAGSTCTIDYSAGDTIGSDPTGCHDFDFDAGTDLMLVDPAAGDLHLESGSPLIDAGNPTAPPAGATDFDGDPRALDATPECSGNVARRDIGADEYTPALPDCDPPDTTLTRTPPKKTRRKKVKFGFEADEDATFKCQLDNKAPVDCDSPWTVRVKRGRHTVRVEATDTAANVEEEPAEYRFRRVRR